MSDKRPRPQREPRGFSTRAIHAASRIPDLEDLQADFASALAAARSTAAVGSTSAPDAPRPAERPVPALDAV